MWSGCTWTTLAPVSSVLLVMDSASPAVLLVADMLSMFWVFCFEVARHELQRLTWKTLVVNQNAVGASVSVVKRIDLAAGRLRLMYEGAELLCTGGKESK